jgi:tRNA nucleotidyltransferase (CCA-adding enzyme)
MRRLVLLTQPEQSDVKTYLVGGAVRDRLMHLVPKDEDYVIVGATAEDVDRLRAEGYSQVGADFPVFLHPVTGDEYALARVERKTGDGYHGFEVDANSSVTIEDDLIRRDLTINSMAMDEDGELVDPYNGQHDLRNRILRHTSAAFAEDPLRVLRLARFAARFTLFTISPNTVELCQALSKNGELNHLSIERVWVELEKGLNEAAPERFMEVLDELGVITHCKVVAEIFGGADDRRSHIAARLKDVTHDRRLVVAIATLAKVDSKLPGANNRARDCFTLVASMQGMPKRANELASLLKRSRAYSAGPTFEDLMTATLVLESAGFKPVFSSRKLITARKVAMYVNASDFPGIEGKALGEAISTGRIEALAKSLNIPI